VLQKVRTETGAEKLLVSLQAAIILSNRAITVRRDTVYQTPETIDAMLPKLKAGIAALVAANSP
jgi:hypothetical protein